MWMLANNLMIIGLRNFAGLLFINIVVLDGGFFSFSYLSPCILYISNIYECVDLFFLSLGYDYILDRCFVCFSTYCLAVLFFTGCVLWSGADIVV